VPPMSDPVEAKELIFLDVGANTGSDGIDLAQRFPAARVFAFEPAPKMVAQIKENAAHLGERFQVMDKAVSDAVGTAHFHCISRVGNPNKLTASSLLPLSDELDRTRPGLIYNWEETVEVDVITLQSFLEEQGLDRIDWMHCDAQGHDLKVLQGFGDKLGALQGGVIEMAKDDDGKLYQGQDHVASDARRFLEEQGFEILTQDENNPWEFNIVFCRPGAQPYYFNTSESELWHSVKANNKGVACNADAIPPAPRTSTTA